MNSIPYTIREVLIASGALILDVSGNLIFAGLTAAESQFFITQNRLPPKKRNEDDAREFALLREKHALALVIRFRDIGINAGAASHSATE